MLVFAGGSTTMMVWVLATETAFEFVYAPLLLLPGAKSYATLF